MNGRTPAIELILRAVQDVETKPQADAGIVLAVPPGDWLTTPRFVLVLGVLIFAAFPQVVLGLQTFVVRDFGFFAYPLAYFQRECFWRGELPFWNPYNNCGVPFLAQWNTMPLYPPALIYLLLPLTWSLGFFCLLHLFWAGLGMYLLAHRWTDSRLGASVAGLIFAFNGLSLNLLMWPSHIATFSWMPWVVLFVERAWQKGGRDLIWASVCGGLQMLAGGPETILLTWLILSALWLVQFFQAIRSHNDSQKRIPLARLWRFLLVVLLVGGLAAAQLLPFIDLVAHSQREQGYADTRWSMQVQGLASFLVPMAFGRVSPMGVFFQNGQMWTSSYYLGTGVLILSALAVWCARRRNVWLMAVATAFALSLALGDQSVVYRWLRHIIPQLSFMTYPVKFVLVVVFIVPLMAAFGMAEWTEWTSLEPSERGAKKRKLLLVSGVLLALIAVILIWAWRTPFPGGDFSATLRNGLVRAAFLVAFTALLSVWARFPSEERTMAPNERKHELKRLAPLFLFSILWFDVWTHEPKQNPTVPASVYTPGLARMKLAMQPQPALGQSRAMLSSAAELKFREFILSTPKDNLLVKRLGYFADCNVLDSVPKVDGFFSLYPRECGELSSVLYGSTNPGFPRLADFMGVSQVTAPGEFFQWKSRDNFLPIVTAGQRPVYANEQNLLPSILATNFDGSKYVLLSSAEKGVVTVTNNTRVQIVSSHFTNERVDVEVEAAEPSLVVLSQTFYHRWHANVDTQPTRLLRANYAFQAVQVPAGRHRVQLVYEDHAFYAGAVISLATFIGCIAAWIGLRFKKRTAATFSSPAGILA